MAHPLYETALGLQARGRLGEARAACEACLRAVPANYEAWTLLGMLSISEQRVGDALAAFTRAAELRPKSVEALANLGAAQLTAGEHALAATTFRRTIARSPNVALLHHNLASALHRCADLEGAEASYARTIALEPSRAAAHRDRASALEGLGRLDDALASCERALSLDPHDAIAHYNAGVILQRLERLEASIDAFQRAVALKPDYPEVYNNLGIVLRRLGHLAPAVASFDRALLLRPNFPDALNNRGLALLDRHLPDAALADFDRALALEPDFALALNSRASALLAQKRYEEAARTFARLIAVQPDFDYALGSLFLAGMYCCDWDDYEGRVERLRAAVRGGARACQPFAFLLVSDDAAEQRRCAESFAADECPAAPLALSGGAVYSHERVRVAYLSADLHDHATAYLMAELFERHDRQRFEVTAVSFGPPAESAMRQRLRAAIEHFVDWRELSDRAIAEQLRMREIDIAIDLKGYTQDARPQILAHRPAPVQLSFLGYPGTSGAPYVDYLVADSVLVPPEHRAHYSEQIVYLPHCYQPNDSRRTIDARTPTRAELGLPEQGFVFCCFNSGYKITPTVFACWMQLLEETPGSVLWLLQTSPAATRNLRTAAQRHGVDADRLRFAAPLPLPEHLARQRRADLFLDTLPVNAHTTASDALWAGLPILTCRGESFVSRVAASLLTALGLPELVTSSLHEYAARALELAHTPTALAALRERLDANRATGALFDARRFCRHFEAALLQVHERHQQGLAPESFSVRAVADV